MFETILRDVFAGTCDNFAIPKADNTPPPDVSARNSLDKKISIRFFFNCFKLLLNVKVYLRKFKS